MIKVGRVSELLDRAIRLSGPLKEPNRDWLYSSYHLPGFCYSNSKRNTLQRLEKLGLGDVAGKTVLDLGSNTGAISFELAKRGAKVFGYEYNQERVDLCNDIARYFALPASFFQIDFNREFPRGQYDLVLSFAVDFYVSNKLKFYADIVAAAAQSSYLEINAHYSREQIEEILRSIPGVNFVHLGDSYLPDERWPVERHRDLFRGTTEKPLQSPCQSLVAL